MSKKIVLGNTYYTACGKEFIPVKVERGRIKKSVNFWSSQQRECRRYIDKDGLRIKKINLYLDKFGSLKIGDIVSHDDYSCENFKVTSFDRTTGIVETKGGKNGTWTNHIDLIIRNKTKWQEN